MANGRHRTASRGRTPSRPVLALTGLALVVVTVGVVTLTSGARRPEPPPAVVVMGDSISAGTAQGGLGDANWTRLVGAERGWSVTNTAIGGTGYLNPGTAGPFEAAQLEAVVAARPRIVLVEGSPNDITLPLDQVSAAASRLYRDLATRLPGARIVAIGPFFDGTPKDDAMAWVDALAAAATQQGVTWIDPMREGWFAGAYAPGRGLIGADRVHPTDAGHALYAQRLDADLDRLGVRSP